MKEVYLLPFDKTLIILPTFNEAENIQKMTETLFGLYPAISILVIDDHSPDGTAALVRKSQEIYPNLHLIEREGKLGLGTAYVMGFKWAMERKFDFVFTMDSDFSHDPKDVANLLENMKDADIVIGSRYINGIRICNWPMRRLLLSYFASHYIRMVTSIPLMDATGGFKCLSRTALSHVDLEKIHSNGYSFQIELNYKLWTKGLRLKEIPITFYERRLGESKMSGAIIREAILIVFRLRLKRCMGSLT